jgi:hypothetical protein
MKMRQMLNKALFLGLGLLVSGALSAASNDLTQVHVDAGEVGQGFLINRLNNCYLVTPAHVLGNEFYANVITGTKSRQMGEAERVQTFGYDLTLSAINGAAKNECNTSINSFGPLDMLLKSSTTLTVSSVNTNGSKSLTPVNMIDLGLVYLTILPSVDFPLYKGLSGSVVYSGDEPVGILQSVDSESGNGKVLRLDRAIETIRPFFASGFTVELPHKSQNQSLAEKVTLSHGIVYEFTEWNHQPLSTNERLGNLQDGDNNSVWAVKPKQDSIEITLSFEKITAISGAVFQAPSSMNQSQPKDFEILSNRRKKGDRGWVSVYSGTWLNNDSDLDININPVKANRLKIVFRSNWGSADRLAFSELYLR